MKTSCGSGEKPTTQPACSAGPPMRCWGPGLGGPAGLGVVLGQGP